MLSPASVLVFGWYGISKQKNGAKNLFITIIFRCECLAQTFRFLPTVPLHTVPRMFSFSKITYFMNAGLKSLIEKNHSANRLANIKTNMKTSGIVMITFHLLTSDYYNYLFYIFFTHPHSFLNSSVFVRELHSRSGSENVQRKKNLKILLAIRLFNSVCGVTPIIWY